MSINIHEEQIYSLLLEHRSGLTIEDVSRLLQISRATAARYLESLYHAGKAERRALGPAKVYRAAIRIHSSDILSVLAEGVLVIDRDGVIKEVNPAFCTAFSLSSDTLRERGLMFTPLAEILTREIIDPLIHPSDSLHEGMIQINGNDGLRYLHYQIIPLWLPDNTLGSVLIIFDKTDIISSQVHTKGLEYEYKDELSRIESHFTRDLKKAKYNAREISSREKAIRDLVQNVRTFIMKINKDGNIVFCNNYASEITGITIVDPGSQISLASLFPVLDEQGVRISDRIQAVRDGIVDFSRWESRLCIHNQLSPSVYSWNLILIRKGKKETNLVLAGFDITDLISREKAVIRSKKQMEWILDHLPDPTFAIDNRRQVILWNKQMEHMTNRLSKDTVGRSIDECIMDIYGYNRPVLAELIFDRYDPTIHAFFEGVSQKGAALTAETVAYQQDGSRRIYWVKATPYYDEDTEVAGAIQSIRDITEIREAEAKIRNEEEFLRGIAESALDCIMVINREGTVLYANQSLGRLLGVGVEQIIGLPIHMVRTMDTALIDFERIKSVFISGVLIHELISIKKDDVDLLMDTTFIPEKDRSGLISSVLIVLKNVSSLREEIADMYSSHRVSSSHVL
ncbi:MAG: PAS domain-containing protein [Methanospirillaceae archaeon]|nr:PAS domain-containing protein [Methanospirillaceae archaeon]